MPIADVEFDEGFHFLAFWAFELWEAYSKGSSRSYSQQLILFQVVFRFLDISVSTLMPIADFRVFRLSPSVF
jgi:hypothetical protein